MAGSDHKGGLIVTLQLLVGILVEGTFHSNLGHYHGDYTLNYSLYHTSSHHTDHMAQGLSVYLH